MDVFNKNLVLVLGFLFIHSIRAETTLIKNASTVITGNPTASGRAEVLHDQDILIEDGIIKNIGKNIHSAPNGKTLDAKGKVVMPGFVDVHEHLWQVSIRGCGHHQELVEWLETCNYIQKDMTKKEAFAAVRLGTYDLINSGVTTVLDWNPSFSEAMAFGALEALQQSGLRYIYAYYPRSDKDFTVNAKIIKTITDKSRLGGFMIASHPNMTLKNHAIKAVRLSEELGVPINFHYAESKNDKRHQQTKVLDEIGAWKRPLILNHVVHVNEDEINAMANAGARLTYNPLSNMRLGSGMMKTDQLHDAGFTIGLGLDGAAQDNANFFSLMKVAVGIQRAAHQSTRVYPDYNNVVLMATSEGAKVLNLEQVTGSLNKNKSADLIIVNPETTNMAVNFDEVAQITLNAEPANVEWVMVNGKILKQDGKLIYASESLEQLIRMNQKTVDRFKQRLPAKTGSVGAVAKSNAG